jgi:hypothetical protein
MPVQMRCWNAHDGKHVLGNGIVKPAQDALVTEAPVRITALRQSGWGGEVGFKTKFTDECIKETTPFIVIRLDKIKNNRHMGFDVYCLEDGSGWSSDGRSVVLNGGRIRGIGIETG